ncbi:tetratricopeptide repeat protein [Jeongeupia wiesaeckerbachi]|uniref:tetratricopeptide repeat protein n=1 Tax=Jeongeupia wiesaeckerbachi TaxID=3051218 RepID=UPI003D809008
MNERHALLAVLEPIAIDAENGSPPPPADVEPLLARARAVGDARLEALAMVTLGHAWQHVGRLRTAQQAFRDAAACFAAAGHTRGRIEALIEYGRARYAAGEIASALDTWSQCLELAHDNGDGDHCARVCLGVGQACVALGDHAGALRYHELALTLARPLGHDRLSCEALINVGGDAYRLRQGDRALAALAEADALLQTKVSNRVWAAEVPYYRGLVYLANGDFDAALSALAQARTAHADNHSVWGEAHSWFALGQAHEAAAQPTHAGECYRAARLLVQGAGLIALHQQLLRRLAALARASDDMAAALAWLRELEVLDVARPDAPVRWNRTQLTRLGALETRSRVQAIRLGLTAHQ